MAVDVRTAPMLFEPRLRRPGYGARLWKTARTKKLGTFGLLLVVIVISSAIFGPMLSPYGENQLFTVRNPRYDPRSIDPKALNKTVAAILITPNRAHPLGTDSIGRDLLTRLFYGARLSLTVGISSAALAVLFGTAIGVLSGYLGGLVDLLVQRLVDAMIAIPGLVLLLLLVQVRSGSETLTIIALSILGVWGIARVIRSATLVVRQEVYVQSARAIGASDRRIMWRHVAPNVVGPVIVSFSVVVGANILAEAGLAFLNLSVHGPSWGQMVNDGRTYLETKPMMSIAAGASITIAVLGFNLLGDGLRDVLDPRQRRAT